MSYSNRLLDQFQIFDYLSSFLLLLLLLLFCFWCIICIINQGFHLFCYVFMFHWFSDWLSGLEFWISLESLLFIFLILLLFYGFGFLFALACLRKLGQVSGIIVIFQACGLIYIFPLYECFVCLFVHKGISYECFMCLFVRKGISLW